MKYIAILLIFLTSISLYSQNYYWYNGEKINLYVDSTKLNITTNKEFSFLKLEQEFISNFKIKKLEESNNNTSLFSIDLPNSKVYSNVIASLKSNKEIVSISPYFCKSDSSRSIGTSSFFYIKLNKEKKEDYEFLSKFASQNNLKIVKQVPYMPLWYILTTSDTKLNSVEASNIAYESGLFADVDPAFMFNFRPNCTNDPYFGQLWGLNNTSNNIDINICDSWNYYTKGNGIKVAVLDQGIDSNHNDLSTNFHSLSFDALAGTSPSAFNGALHGTHVAGIVAAIKDNNLQVVGVAPESKIMRVSHPLGANSTLSAELASGISWAWQNGADVINNSWGDQGGYYYNYLFSSILENSIINAMTQGRNRKGSVVVFASGNWSVIDYPANFHSDILCVGAINDIGKRSIFNALQSSACGQELDVVAPGSDILSTIPNNRIALDSGTSMAAPHVSGVAALILSVNPDLTHKEVSYIIESTAQEVGGYNYSRTPEHPNGLWNNEMGYGLVNAYAAVLYAMNYPCNSTTLTGTQTTKRVICKEIIMQNATVPNGVTLELKATESVIINSGVTVKTGGTLEVDGATVTIDTEFTIEEGAIFVIK